MVARRREQLTYGEPCESGAGRSLRVTARLAEGVVLRAPLMLDGLLAWSVASRHRLLPPQPGEAGATIEVPVEREPNGRFHLCSQGLYQVECIDARSSNGPAYKNRRAPVTEFARLGSSKIKRVAISLGANKSYRVPYSIELVHGDEIAWYCVGDADRIRDLLSSVHYLGRFRGSGKGRLDLHRQPWRVEECEPWGSGFPVVDSDGRPLRQLPIDWPGLSSVATAQRTLTYPYYDQTRHEFCAVPS